MQVPNKESLTGISRDYFDEYAAKIVAFETCGRTGVAKEFVGHPVPTYTELYPPDRYSFSCQAGSRAYVLDIVARIANRRLTNSELFTDEFFKRLINKAYTLIFDLGPCFQV